jgi:radical SAM family uncharacterized protein/radical SAM-linked protein
MSISKVQDILSHIEKPSRYLGTEINSICKDPASVKLNIALAFPDMYEIGTSHFGIQILYHILNNHEHIAAERVFAPARDMEARLRQNQISLTTLETGRPLKQFDMIGFSLLYELNYTNVLNMLDMSGLPLRANQRSESHPLVIAGGPCVCNPEPMAPFFDAMVFGDGEEVMLQMSKMWLDWKKSAHHPDKLSLLEQWSGLEGLYIPQFFRTRYDHSGFQILEPDKKTYTRVRRSVVADLESTLFPESPIVPFSRPVHDRLRLEISRGCTRGCRFCQAGMIYRPVRERSGDQLLSLARCSLESTGYEDLSLLSLSTGDYTCLSELMENLMLTGRKNRVAVSLPSVRAGTLTTSLMALIKQVRKTGFTIAPEAGSQRLRNVINKNITEEDVAATVQNAFALGWKVIKLYFMIGLPTETDRDVDEIAEMVKRLKTVKGPERRRGQINVSINTFIPKPHTPFQWASQISLDSSYEKMERIKSRLNISGIKIKWQNPEMSLLEGEMARGDRRLADVVEWAWKNGALFDGWTDEFNFERWQRAFSACGLEMGFFSTRKRAIDEPLPWTHMESGVTTAFFQQQWKAAQEETSVKDCRYGECHHCGVCDFKRIHPRVFHQCERKHDEIKAVTTTDPQEVQWLELTYSKLDQARFFGHLEQANIISRALRRAGIDVQYSMGFHPKPQISYDDPLPLGMESEAEHFRLSITSEISCENVMGQLNQHLPEGLTIIRCRPVFKRKASNHHEGDIPGNIIERYLLCFPHADIISDEKIDLFHQSLQWPHTRYKTKGRCQTVDLKEWVQRIDVDHAHHLLHLELICRQGNIIRPSDILTGIFGLSLETQHEIRVRKLAPPNELHSG